MAASAALIVSIRTSVALTSKMWSTATSSRVSNAQAPPATWRMANHQGPGSQGEHSQDQAGHARLEQIEPEEAGGRALPDFVQRHVPGDVLGRVHHLGIIRRRLDFRNHQTGRVAQDGTRQIRTNLPHTNAFLAAMPKPANRNTANVQRDLQLSGPGPH